MKINASQMFVKESHDHHDDGIDIYKLSLKCLVSITQNEKNIVIDYGGSNHFKHMMDD